MPPRTLAAKVIDVAVFTPLTLAVEVSAEIPGLVARTGREVQQRVRVARWVGEMAVNYGRSAIEQRLASSRDDE